MSPTTHTIITCDSRKIQSQPDKSVNLIVTSPPYPMIEMWDDLFEHQNPGIADDLKQGLCMAAFEKMHIILDDVWMECDRVLKDGGFFCVNIGDATRTIDGDFRLYSNHSRIIKWFIDHGYSVLPDIHWRKQSNAPNKFMGSGMYPAGAYVTYEHEYILIFRKGKKRIFSDNEKALRQRSAFFWEERNTWFSDLWEIRGTGQKLEASKGRDRSAAYPLEVPYRLVNMYSSGEDLVLDPFAGLGTTALACMASGRNSICVDIVPELVVVAKQRMLAARTKLNELIDDRIGRHRVFIGSLPPNTGYYNAYHAFPVKTRQEVAIQIDRIESIRLLPDGSIFCDYERQLGF